MHEPINPYQSPQVESTLPPGGQWAQDVSPSLRQTRIGLTMVYIGILTVLLSAIFGVVIPIVAVNLPITATIFAFAGFGLMIGFVLSVIGPIFCLAVPSESGARGLIIGSVILQIGNLLSAGTQVFGLDIIPGFIRMGLGVAGAVGAVLFVLFMRKLALYIGRVDLAARARNILIATVVLVLLGLITSGGSYYDLQAFVYATIPMAVGCLVVFVMYANLVNWLRQALKV